jgi:hypothetical protein
MSIPVDSHNKAPCHLLLKEQVHRRQLAPLSL